MNNELKTQTLVWEMHKPGMDLVLRIKSYTPTEERAKSTEEYPSFYTKDDLSIRMKVDPNPSTEHHYGYDINVDIQNDEMMESDEIDYLVGILKAAIDRGYTKEEDSFWFDERDLEIVFIDGHDEDGLINDFLGADLQLKLMGPDSVPSSNDIVIFLCGDDIKSLYKALTTPVS